MMTKPASQADADADLQREESRHVRRSDAREGVMEASQSEEDAPSDVRRRSGSRLHDGLQELRNADDQRYEAERGKSLLVEGEAGEARIDRQRLHEDGGSDEQGSPSCGGMLDDASPTKYEDGDQDENQDGHRDEGPCHVRE